MSHRITFGLDDANFALATAYAADRGLEVYEVARSMLIAEVKRHAHRSGLLSEIEKIIEQKVADRLPNETTPKNGFLGGESLDSSSESRPKT